MNSPNGHGDVDPLTRLRAGALRAAAALRAGWAAGAPGRRALAARILAGLDALRTLPGPSRTQWLAAAAAVVIVLWIGWQRCGLAGCPNVERLAAYQPGGAPVLLDRAGEPFAELAPVDRQIIDLDSLPAHVGQAFIAVEDRRFHDHGGYDLRRVGGALLANVRAGGVAQGSSTITMQMARNVFPERLPGAERTLRRKLVELRVAREIERKFSKDEILELYLNYIYFSGGVYGVEAAAREFFGVPAARLTLAQAATLAAMPRSPNHYNPRRNPDGARSRRDLVLSMMEAQGLITAEQAGTARASALRVAATPPPRRAAPPPAPFFVEAVRSVLEARFGDGLYSSALRIHTTLDRAAQAAAESQLERQLRNIENGTYGRFTGVRYSAARAPTGPTIDYLQGAVVMIDAHEGDVLALVGGRDFRHSRFDRALRARRQVGSAFKPFVFAAAIADGYAPSQRIADSPLRMELTGGEIWEPRNFTGGFEDELTLRDALVRSKNVPAVRLATAVGLRDVARLAQRAGVHSEIPELPSMALGTAALSPFEVTRAYLPFANGGDAVEPRWVLRVEDPDGRVVWESRVRKRRALDPAVSFLVTDMLEEAVRRGTGSAVRSAGFRAPAAGKTGTTDGGADVWFVGYTPDVVAGVWIGFDRPARIVADASGGRIAAPLWGRMMQQLYRGRPAPEAWQPPDRIVQRATDASTGLVLADGCRPLRGRPADEYFIRGREPARSCPDGELRDGGPGVLARLAARGRNLLSRSGGWVLARLGGDDERPRRDEQERLLGTARLPRPADVPTPEVERPPIRLLGREWRPDSAADTAATARVDTLESAAPGAAARGVQPGDTVLVLVATDSGFVLQPRVITRPAAEVVGAPPVRPPPRPIVPPQGQR